MHDEAVNPLLITVAFLEMPVLLPPTLWSLVTWV